MAVVERRMAQDCVAIYSCDTWTQVTVSFKYIFLIYSNPLHIICLKLIDSESIDIGGINWSPDGSKIAIWDGISNSGKIGIYLVNGSKFAEIIDVFGIHSIEWSPSAQILAVATVGSKVRTFRFFVFIHFLKLFS